MWFYAILFLIPIAWGLMPESRRPALALGTTLILTLFIGLRHHVGGDWYSYWLMLERAYSRDLGTALVNSDPAYMALNVLAARLGFSVALVNLVCGALLASGVVAFARRQKRPWVALLVAVPVLLTVVAMNTTRQSAAIGLELLALAWLLDGRRVAPLGLLILACAFHWTAAILLPLGFLLLAPRGWRPVLAWGFAGIAMTAVLGLWILEAVRAFHLPGLGGGPRLLATLLAAGLLPFLRRRGEVTGASAAIAFYLAGVAGLCLAILPISSLAADRLGLYTIALQMLLLPSAPEAFSSRLIKRAMLPAVVAVYLTLFAGWALLSSYTRCMVPYDSYLLAPDRLIGREWPEPFC